MTATSERGLAPTRGRRRPDEGAAGAGGDRASVRLCGRDLTLAYGERVVADRLDVEIPDRRLTAVVGANASGKSTLLRALVRLVVPTRGQVVLDGRDVAHLRGREYARQVAFLPQESIAPEGITMIQLVRRGRYPHRGPLLSWWTPQDEAAVREAMELAGVTHLADRPVAHLSGGQRQRGWIALVLAQATPYLLLDEPTTFLDVRHQHDLLRLLARLRDEGRTVVAVLHDINQACRYADHVVALAGGRVVAAGSPREVVTAQLMSEVFDLPSLVVDDPAAGTPLVVPLP